MAALTPTLRACAPAKLNLFLHITGRRADGYHTLQTLFQRIDLQDQISAQLRGDGNLTRSGGLADLPAEQDLVVRAARALQQETGCPLGADLHVDKQIPAGAGLGGGSSDAATTLLLLNRLWQLDLSTARLQNIGLQLGADVPFFLGQSDAWAEGIGELLQPVQLPPATFVVLFPAVHCATARLFAEQDLLRNCPAISFADFKAGSRTCNVFEAVALRLFPELKAAADWLNEQAGSARLTGSGSAWFARTESFARAQQIAQDCPKSWRAWAVRSL